MPPGRERGIPTGRVPLHAAHLAAVRLREQTARMTLDNIDTKGAARNMANIRRAYPTLGPKIVAALGIAGHGPDDEMTKYLAAAQMVKHAKPFWQSIDTDEKTRSAEHANGNLVDEWAQRIRDYSPELKGTPQTPDPKQDAWAGGIVSDLGAVFKAVARPAFSALETPYQGLVGAERNIASNIEQKGVVAGLTTDPFGPENKVSVGEQTSGGLAVQALSEGRKVDLGTGVFPGGKIEEQQAENSRRAFSIAGHALTPGRLAASWVTEPGTKPYELLSGLTDAASIIATDPANIALSKVSDVRAARKTFTIGQTAEDLNNATGLINGLRKAVHGPTAEAWLTQSHKGQKVVEKLAKREGEGGLTFLQTLKTVNGHADLAAKLHNASSPDEVMDLLRPALGYGLREQPKLPYAFTKPLRDVTDGWRIAGKVPPGMGDLKNMDGMVPAFDSWLRNAKVSLAERNRLTKQVVEASGREEQYAVIKDGAHAVERQMIEHGAHANDAKSLTKLFDGWDDFRHYMIDETGKDVTPFFVVDGKPVEMKTPAHFIDFLNRTVPLPNARQIRGVTDNLSRFRQMPGPLGKLGDAATFDRDLAMYAGDKIMKYWKPAQLARLGWPLRVIGEEQVRMAMSGYESMFSHPIHFITQIMSGPKGDIQGRSFKDLAEIASQTGETDAYAGAMSGWGRQYITSSDEMGRRLKGFHVLDRDMEPQQFARAWHESIARLSNDSIVERIAKFGPADAKEWFLRGDGSKLRQEMLGGPEDVTFTLGSESGANSYVDIIAADLKTLVNDDPQLLRAIAERKATINGRELTPFKVSNGGKVHLNKDFARHLADRTAAGHAPQKMIGQVSISGGKEQRGLWDKSVGFLFDHLMTIPTNKLSRSPVFEQSYYKRIGELAHGMGPEHRAAAAAVAEENGFGKIAKAIRKIKGEPGAEGALDAPDGYLYHGTTSPNLGGIREQGLVPMVENDQPARVWFGSEQHASRHAYERAGRDRLPEASYGKNLPDSEPVLLRTPKRDEPFGKGGPRLTGVPADRLEYLDKATGEWRPLLPRGVHRALTPAEADDLAKVYALNQTKDLLYDLSERSQFFDIWRNFFPFGEAWKEVLGRWAKITYEHPETLRKFQVGVEGARGAGFFTTDPTTGQEMFNFPGSAWMTKELFGVPVPLAGTVSGLNIVGNGTPGVGPLIQLPAAYFLPDKPEYDAIRHFVMPFGDQDSDPGGNIGKTLVNSLTPSWMEKAFKAISGPESDRQFANAVMAQAAYLRTTGDYGNSPEDMRKLMEDAKSNAQEFFVVRSLASLTAPTAPIPQSGVLDKDGNFMMLMALKDEYNKGLADGTGKGQSYDDIDQNFIAKYGTEIYGAMQPFTRSLVLSLPVYPSQVRWERSNPEIRSKYPDVYGFFAPRPKKGEKFDQTAYQRQVDSHQRQALSPTTWNRLANDKIATHLYYQARAKMPDKPTREDRQWLRDVHAQLIDEYDGFESDRGIEGRANTDEMVRQLARAVKDPALARTKNSKGIGLILQARNMVASAAKQMNPPIVSWQTANASLNDRVWLANIYDDIRKEYPGTAPALDMVFRNDVRYVDG